MRLTTHDRMVILVVAHATDGQTVVAIAVVVTHVAVNVVEVPVVRVSVFFRRRAPEVGTGADIDEASATVAAACGKRTEARTVAVTVPIRVGGSGAA